MKVYSLLLASAAVLSFSFSPAQAQAVNHGSLQEIFGEAVTTSATGKPQRVSEVPTSMEIITTEQIRRSGASDIPTILSRYAGLNATVASPSDTQLNIRGYQRPDSPRILVLINGRQVYMDFYGLTNWSALPIDISEIRQIEVVKGPNTALFGFNAAAGVVNIITFNPLYDMLNTARVAVGTQDRVEAAGVMTWHNTDKNMGLRLSTHGSNSRDFEGSTSANAITPAEHTRALNADWLYQITSDTQIGAELSYVKQRRGEIVPTYVTSSNDYEISSGKLSYQKDSDWGLITGQSYINNVNIVAPISSLGTIYADNSVIVTQFSDLLKLNTSNTVRLFAEHRFNEIQLTNIANGKTNYHVASLGAMWDWDITETLCFTNAVRYDRMMINHEGAMPANFPYTSDLWTRTLETVSYNSGLVWKASPFDTVRLTAARGIQMPSLISMSPGIIDTSGYGLYVSGNPRLDPTIVTNYEIGYDRNILSIDGKVSARIYHQFNQDLMTFNRENLAADVVATAPALDLAWTTNSGNSTLNGFEISAEGRINHGWDWDANYTLTLIDDNLSSNSANRLVRYAGGTPVHVFNAHLGWANEDWEIDGYLNYQTAFKDYQDVATVAVPSMWRKVDDVWSVSARVGYNITDTVTVALTGQQLNIAQRETTASGRDTERRVMLSTSVKF